MTDALKFEPAHITVAAGDTIVWVNVGVVPHTVTDDPRLAGVAEHSILPRGADSWDSAMVKGGARFTWVFTQPGEYTYVCLYHEAAAMIGRVTVR